MHITFGLGFDAYQHPDDAACLDATVVGENGLLALLEERLGLVPPPEYDFERLGPVSEALAAEGPDSFFGRSFEVDSIGVSREAIRWVDDLLLASDAPLPDFPAAKLPRLQAVCRLAAHDTEAIYAGHGGRIRRILPVLRALDSPAEIGIEEVRHLATLECLPRGWELLLEALGATPVDEPESAADPDCSLGRVAAFLSDPSSPAPVDLRDDGSLRLVTATSESALAEHLAGAITSRGTADGLGIVSGGEDLVLDAAFLGQGLPPLGNARSGPLAAPGQLLGLALETLWSPFDPAALLAFLHHPLCPVQWQLRQKLIAQLVRSPGKPADGFAKVLEKAEAWIRKGNTEDKDAAVGQARDDLAHWVCHRRYSAEDGIPSEAVAALATAVALTLPEREVGARNLARAFERLVASRNEPSLRPELLSRLLSETVAGSTGGPPVEAALGCPAALRQPEFAMVPLKDLAWWGFVDDDPAARPWWTEKERAALEDCDFHLRERIPNLAAQARPFRAVGKSLSLYVPKSLMGGATRPHPILDRLVAAEVTLPVTDLDALMATRQAEAGLVPTTLRPLPARRRWWTLPDTDLFRPRSPESYTSLAKLLSAPQDWVLDRVAGLSKNNALEGIPLTLPANVEGTLIHCAAEHYFQERWNPGQTAELEHATISDWVAENWPKLVEEQAALLLQQGQQLTSAHLKGLTTDALSRLAQILRHLEADQVWCEKAFYGEDALDFRTIQIGGYVDLLAGRPDGSTAVIDLKLGGVTGRRDDLRAGRQLQIAVYAKLASRGGDISAMPSGYYIIKSRKLVCLEADRQHFGPAYIDHQKPHKERGDLEAVWESFAELYDWRRDQLAGGRIELPVEGTEADLLPPVDGWFPKKPADNRYSDFRTLHGWLATQ